MGSWTIDIRGAQPSNGHSDEPPVFAKISVEAENWEEARQCASRRYSIGIFDPLMLAVPAELVP